jgi:hypothetical protein
MNFTKRDLFETLERIKDSYKILNDETLNNKLLTKYVLLN